MRHFSLLLLTLFACNGLVHCQIVKETAALAYEKFMSNRAVSYTYQAEISDNTQGSSSSIVDVTVFNRRKIPSNVPNNAIPIEEMFMHLIFGKANASAPQGYTSKESYPVLYETPVVTIRILSVRFNATDLLKEGFIQQLDYSLQRWNDFGYDLYSYKIEWSYLINLIEFTPSNPTTYTVNIEEGVVKSVVQDSLQKELKPAEASFRSLGFALGPITSYYPTMAMQVNTAVRPDVLIDVTFDPSLMYVSRWFAMDYRTNRSVSWRIHNLVPASQPYEDNASRWILAIILVLVIVMIIALAVALCCVYRRSKKGSASNDAIPRTDRTLASAGPAPRGNTALHV
jgi:hypothetical protein